MNYSTKIPGGIFFLVLTSEGQMKTLIILLLLFHGSARAASYQVYARCFDGNYGMAVDGVIEIYDQVSGSSKYNAEAKLKIQASIFDKSTYSISGFVRYDHDPGFKTFRFLGSYLYQDERPSGFKILLGDQSTFGAEISYGKPPLFDSQVVKLYCDFNLNPFPNYRNEVH